MLLTSFHELIKVANKTDDIINCGKPLNVSGVMIVINADESIEVADKAGYHALCVKTNRTPVTVAVNMI